MRLLRLQDDGEFSLTEFAGNSIPRYAVLSHTWGSDDEEVSFKDLIDGTGKTKAGYHKIRFCSKQAANDGLQFFWMDTCCIDKSSSAELSEAINSMFNWYHNAAKCYAYLSDVSMNGSVGTKPLFPQTWKVAFQHSRWFTRGWTLQELIAPTYVEFFSVEGERLGDKDSMVQEIQEITGISSRALQGSPLSRFSVDERMSWAAIRKTRREEDAAYSLLGLFDIHMPLIYGEGRKKAFIRLQREIKESMKEFPTLPQNAGTESQSRASSLYSGPVFHGPISGRYVIPGTYITGGTVNFNFSEGMGKSAKATVPSRFRYTHEDGFSAAKKPSAQLDESDTTSPPVQGASTAISIGQSPIDLSANFSDDERLVNPSKWNAKLTIMEQSIIDGSSFRYVKDIDLLDLPRCQKLMSHTLQSVEKMRETGYCGNSISAVVARKDRGPVAELVSIPLGKLEEIQELTDLSGCLDLLRDLRLNQIAEQVQQLSYENQTTALQFAATVIVKFLDIAIVSYSGAHFEDFRTKGFDSSLEDASEIDITESLILRPRYLQCLDAYFHHEQVWVFEEVDLGQRRADTPLYLLTTMEVFSGIWGPVWAVHEQERISRFNVGVGSIFPWTREPTDPELWEGEIFAHWTDHETDLVQHLPSFPPYSEKMKLLIGANTMLSINANCPLEPDAYTTSLRERNCLGTLGTEKPRMCFDSSNATAVVTPPGVQVGGQLQWKLRRGSTLKDSILAAWCREPDRRDPKVLSGWYGVEVSLCTGNARRQRLGRILGSWAMRNYLEGIFLDWPSEECKESYFNSLNSEDASGVSEFRQLYCTRPEWRQPLAFAVVRSFEALKETGTQPNYNFTALFSPNNREAWKATFPKRDQTWAGLLKDTVESCTVGVVTPYCLEFANDRWPSLCRSTENSGLLQCPRGSGILETAMLINEKAHIPQTLKKSVISGSKPRWIIQHLPAYTTIFDLGESGRLAFLSCCDGGMRAIMTWKSPNAFRRLQERVVEEGGGRLHHWERVLDISSPTDPINIYVTSV